LAFNEDLVFMKFQDKNEKKVGYVFYYPENDSAFMIEADQGDKKLIKDLEFLEYVICKILYIYHNKKEPLNEKD
jgi:hypothetical protein